MSSSNLQKPLPLPNIIGHRGAKSVAPENTLASIRAAKRLGCTFVEVDVMLSNDKVACIHHDNTLDRCTNGRGFLWDQNIDALRSLDAGSWFDKEFAGEKLPLLSEVIQTCRDLNLGLNLEIKHATDKATDVPTPEEREREIELAEKVCVDIVDLEADPSSIVFSSFSRDAIRVLYEKLPHFKRSFLVEGLPEDWEDFVARYECVSLNFNHKEVPNQKIAEISSLVPTYCYTVNEPGRARELFALGVKGVFSDWPHVIQEGLIIIDSPQEKVDTTGTSLPSSNLPPLRVAGFA